MWPTLLQPWYFNFPEDIAVSDSGEIFVSDKGNQRIVKLNSQGQLIGSTNKAAGLDLNTVVDLAIGHDGFLYVSEIIAEPGGWVFYFHKYDKNLNYVGQVYSLKELENNSSFFSIEGMVQFEGYLYLNIRCCFSETGTANGKVVRIDILNQTLDTGWGIDKGNNEPGDIAIDQNGNIYVSEISGVKKYSQDGVFVLEFESFPEISTYPPVEVAENGRIYLFTYFQLLEYDIQGKLLASQDLNSDEWCRQFDQRQVGDEIEFYCVTDRGVTTYTQNGALGNSWASKGDEAGYFSSIGDIAIDSDDTVYVVDRNASSQQKQITKLDRNGKVLGLMDLARDFVGISLLESIQIWGDQLYVSSVSNVSANANDLPAINIYSLEGEYVSTIAMSGTGLRIFDFVIGADGSIYAVVGPKGSIDRNSRVDQQSTSNWFSVAKFDSAGNLLVEYDRKSSTRVDLAIDRTGRVVAYTGSGFEGNSDNIYFFDEELRLDSSGSVPVGNYASIAFSQSGDIFLSDGSDNGESQQIHRYSPDLTLLETFSGAGVNPGFVGVNPRIVLDSEDRLYVADARYERVQRFSPTNIVDNTKAIVVAAGGPFSGNNLWDSTQLSANFAYRALTYQGFTKNSIYYLSSDTDLDLDQNGVADDVDADATNANLEYAIKQWAADADNLVIYMVDHGGVNTFRMSGEEILHTDDLARWVNDLQASVPDLDRVTLIYDACESGTFLSALAPPAGFDRTLITSTSPGENAVFVSQGSISFSNFFWTHVFNGLSLESAFSLASEALTSTTDHQHPMLDYNGDGLSDATDLALSSKVFIGNGTDLEAEAPSIFGVSSNQVITGTSTATVTANDVVDSDGVARVWAVVRPPDYQQGASGNPVQDLPSFDLRSDGAGNYSGTWDQFTSAGTYQLAIYATDSIGNTSVPQLTAVSVQSPLSKRAIIIAAGAANDPDYELASKSADVAYEALKQQGYDDEAIYYMNHNGVPGIDVSPSMSNVEFYLTDISGSDTQDLVLYIVGDGSTNTITISDGEVLSSDQLRFWLDSLTDKIPGNVTVVLDTDNAGSFITALSANKRIIVTSTGAAQRANFFNQGDISFSHSYWRKVFNGATVRDAYLYARSAMRFSAGFQEAQLDDNGDRIPNTKQDGNLARLQTHGTGILLAGDEPLIGSVSANDEIFRNEQSTITVNNVTTTGEIDKVIAVVTAPDQSTITYTLGQSGTSYTSSQIDFSIPGSYDIALYARDTAGNLSLPSTTTVEVKERGFDLELVTDQSSYSSGNILNLSTSATIDGTRAYSGAVDIYLQVILPDGSTFFLTDLSPSITTQPTPVLTNWSPTSLPGTPILSLPLPDGLPDGNYSWKLTFTKATQPYLSSTDWLAQGRAVHAIQ